MYMYAHFCHAHERELGGGFLVFSFFLGRAQSAFFAWQMRTLQAPIGRARLSSWGRKETSVKRATFQLALSKCVHKETGWNADRQMANDEEKNRPAFYNPSARIMHGRKSICVCGGG